MRYAMFSTVDDPSPRLGAVHESGMADVRKILGQDSPTSSLLALIQAGPEIWSHVAGRIAEHFSRTPFQSVYPVTGVRWHAPIPRPSKNIVCLGLNYASHVRETAKLDRPMKLPDLPISPTTVRVPVFTAHSVAVNAETEARLGRERAREVLAGFPGLKLWDEPADNRYPMPVLVEGQDDCYVGRIREDLSMPNALNFWVVGDQLRKGAALNGIQIAELLIR